MIGLLAMARSSALGGALLALTIVAKLFPGILVIYLVAHRRWRDVGWTAGFALALSVVAYLVVGGAPFHAFLSYELPRLSSGEAFAGPFSRLFAVARNMSPFGLSLKLTRLGVPAIGLGLGRVISACYGLAMLALAVWAGLRAPRSSSANPEVLIGLLGLASLASPFAPANYVLVPLVWLVLACSRATVTQTVVLWLLTSLPFFLPSDTAFVWQMLAFLPAQILALAAPVGMILRTMRSPKRRGTAAPWRRPRWPAALAEKTVAVEPRGSEPNY